MTTLLIGLTVLGTGSFAAWRLANCPVMRALGLGMTSWAERCRTSERVIEPLPDYTPHDPFPPYEPNTVEAARRVA